MPNVNPSYQSVAKSGVASQETPDPTGFAPYSEVKHSGVSNPQQTLKAPPVPEDTPAQNGSYDSLKN